MSNTLPGTRVCACDVVVASPRALACVSDAFITIGGVIAVINGPAANGAITANDVISTMNSTGGVNAGCIAATPPELQWQCIFANASYAHIQTPIFPLNSAIDAWQMDNVFELEPTGAKYCTTNEFDNCTATQITLLDAWEKDFMHDIMRSNTFQKPGNGGFVESCLEHCAAQSSAEATTFEIDGVSMMQALTSWWYDAETVPAKEHWHLPCSLSTSLPHQCNPTCSAKTATSAIRARRTEQ